MITAEDLEREVVGEYRTFSEVATKFGVSRQRIHQLVTRYALQRPAKPPKYTCPLCSLAKLPRRDRSGRLHAALPGRHRSCIDRMPIPILHCSSCGTRIKATDNRSRHSLRSRYRRNSSGEWFCNRSCLGHYAGLYFGFGRGVKISWPTLPDYTMLTPEVKTMVEAILAATTMLQDPHLRDEVCQEAAILVLGGEVDVAKLPEHLPRIIRGVSRAYPRDYGPISIDMAPPWDDNAPTLATKLKDKPEAGSMAELMAEVWS